MYCLCGADGFPSGLVGVHPPYVVSPQVAHGDEVVLQLDAQCAPAHA